MAHNIVIKSDILGILHMMYDTIKIEKEKYLV